MSKRNLRPIKLGLVVGSREFFNGAPALQTRAELLSQLDRLNVASAILPVEATKNGAVQSREDARRYAAFFREQRDTIDGLVICLPNFGDEIAISELVNEARLDVPILLQASNDEIDKVDVKSRRDAFCGKFSVANNFYQYGVPFTDTTSHTSDVDGAEFGADLDRFVRICRVVRGLRRARIGSIGARTGSFQTMRFSEKLLQASGLTVVTVDLSEIIFAANAIADDAPEVKAKLAEIEAYGRIPSLHQAGQDRSTGEVDARGRSLDRRERMRRQRHSVLAQPAGQFRLRDLSDDEHDGREAQPERLRGRRHGRDLDVCACAGGGSAVRDPRLEQQLRPTRPTSASAPIAATTRRASSAKPRRSQSSTSWEACSARRTASAPSRARCSRDR